MPTPYKLPGPIKTLFADIEARRTYDGQEQEIIIIEVKCFLDPDAFTHDLYVAIGQYLVYRDVMQKLELPHPLFLAIPSHIYYGMFRSMADELVRKYEIKLLLVNLNDEEIEQWLE